MNESQTNMPERSLDERIALLENRLVTMERTTKRWRTGFIGALASAALLVLMGAGPGGIPDLIQAHAFQVVDMEGKPIIALSGNAGGGGMMMVFNGNGKPIVLAGASASGGVLGISNDQGAPLALMEATPSGGTVSTRGANGLNLAQMGARAEGGIFVLNNGSGVNNVVLRTEAAGGALDLNGPQGKRLVSALGSRSGGGIVVLDTAGAARTTISCGDDTGVISLFGTSGKIRWQAPSLGFSGGEFGQ